MGIGRTLQRLADVLAFERERGESFDTAWRLALRAVKPSSDTRAILADTIDAWQRAYELEPQTPAEHAIGELWALLDAEPEPIAA